MSFTSMKKGWQKQTGTILGFNALTCQTKWHVRNCQILHLQHFIQNTVKMYAQSNLLAERLLKKICTKAAELQDLQRSQYKLGRKSFFMEGSVLRVGCEISQMILPAHVTWLSPASRLTILVVWCDEKKKKNACSDSLLKILFFRFFFLFKLKYL